MAVIVVSGLVNLETTVRVDAFPVGYEAVRYPFFGVRSRASGVGFNIAKALHTLGNEVRLCSLIGEDDGGVVVRRSLEAAGLSRDFVRWGAAETAQSVVLTDPGGQRAIFSDLKDVQERTFPQAEFEQALAGADLVVACNVNFSRPLLRLARERGIPIATDLHAISGLENPYDADFLGHADLLFFSGERLERPEAAASEALARFPARLVVVGLGARGAMLTVRGHGFWTIPAVSTRSVVSTVGAGDALLSGFVHHHLRWGDARAALERAAVFASWKIGEDGGANGFLGADALERLHAELR